VLQLIQPVRVVNRDLHGRYGAGAITGNILAYCMGAVRLSIVSADV
jgi:hypothetical protein